MTEWVLPAETQKEFVGLTNSHPENTEWKRLVWYTRGGFWRNFRTRYSESHEMYCRMVQVSQRLAGLENRTDLNDEQRSQLSSARTHLYRSQCNCSYWHGAFGGLYLPHLRNAVYRELILADGVLDAVERRGESWVDVSVGDFNFDARQELRMSNHRLQAWIAPAQGGQMYELDVRNAGVNVLATLNRRPEAYHQRIIDYARRDGKKDNVKLASINDEIKFKQPDLDQKIFFDTWSRKSLVDHFFRPMLKADEFRRGEGLIGDFVSGTYEASVRRTDSRVAVELRRTGSAGGLEGEIRRW